MNEYVLISKNSAKGENQEEIKVAWTYRPFKKRKV